jgi:23S rRNA pseudouridine1911/1915/1917 synthase
MIDNDLNRPEEEEEETTDGAFTHEDDSASSDEMYEHYRIVVDKGQTQVRIDKFLMDRLQKVSRSKIQNAIRAGSITVDDEVIKPNFKIRPLQVISIVFPHMPSDGVVYPDYVPLDIVYEDDDLMIINKQVGLVVHPGVGNPRNTLVNGLAYYFKDKLLPFHELSQDNRPGLVHRIDKDTSGLMVVAKNHYAMNYLAKQFFHHTIERRYNALVWGEPAPLQGTIRVNVGRSIHDPTLIMAFPEGEAGKHAVTHYKVIEPLYYVSLIECKLETGRTHQIRVHMKHAGHPLFMDERYGGHRILKGTIFSKYKQFVLNVMDMIPRQALHARSIGFEHPTTKEWMYFESELPTDFQNALNKWRSYVEDRRSLL